MTMQYTALIQAFDYVSTITDVPNDIWIGAASAGVFKAASELTAINSTYHNAITEALTTYFEGGSVTGPRNQYKRAMVEAFGSAFDLAWTDGGGTPPPDADAVAWLNARVEQELGFIDGVFAQAKELRKDKEADTFAWTNERADGYVGTVRDVYNMGKMYAAGNMMLTFAGEDGQPDNICQSNNGTCVQLKGQRHKASWWLAHDLVPYRGNKQYNCGAWECSHFLQTDDGERFTQ